MNPIQLHLPTPAQPAMGRRPRLSGRTLAVWMTSAALLAAAPAWADKPEWAGRPGGNSKMEKEKGPRANERGPRQRADRDDDRRQRDEARRSERREWERREWERRDDDRRPARGDRRDERRVRPPLPQGLHYGGYFRAPQRVVVRNYYEPEYRAGRCPPGLAKKGNGCLPPGQAKKLWRVGQPLPRSVVYYPLPQPVVVQLGVPPPGYEYVRVATDILLVAAGTRMVIDGMSGLLGGF